MKPKTDRKTASKVRDIIVIGSSAGGVKALVALVKTLPHDFAGSIFIAQHVAPFTESILPEVLSTMGPLPAEHPRDGQEIKAGRIYIAPRTTTCCSTRAKSW